MIGDSTTEDGHQGFHRLSNRFLPCSSVQVLRSNRWLCWSRKELRVKMWANNFFFFSFFKSDNGRFLKKILMENRRMENRGCFLILFAWTFNSFSFPSYVACCIDWNDLSSSFLRILFPCNNFFQKYLNES